MCEKQHCLSLLSSPSRTQTNTTLAPNVAPTKEVVVVKHTELLSSGNLASGPNHLVRQQLTVRLATMVDQRYSACEEQRSAPVYIQRVSQATRTQLAC